MFPRLSLLICLSGKCLFGANAVPIKPWPVSCVPMLMLSETGSICWKSGGGPCTFWHSPPGSAAQRLLQRLPSERQPLNSFRRLIRTKRSAFFGARGFDYWKVVAAAASCRPLWVYWAPLRLNATYQSQDRAWLPSLAGRDGEVSSVIIYGRVQSDWSSYYSVCLEEIKPQVGSNL